MRLYNTLSGQELDFVPADGKTVKMYVCGVTPYSSTHVGHALSYVVFDTLRRYLEHQGYQVRHIQNFYRCGRQDNPAGAGSRHQRG